MFSDIKRILLRSSSYEICISNALAIQTLYLYGTILSGVNPFSIFSGLLLYSFHEYASHRFILHYTHTSQLYHYLHGNHHANPFGRSIHIPILYSTLFHMLYFYMLYTYTSFLNAVNVMCTYQVCYIVFEHMHKEVYHPSWDARYVEQFRTFHMYHHMTNKNMAYSFSTPLWDILCGTFPHDVLEYNWFAFVPLPFLGFYLGTDCKRKKII